MFIIHLVPLVLEKIICMQEKIQKWTNMKHRRQWDVTGGPWAHMHIGQCYVASPDGPTPLPHHWSAWRPLHYFSTLDPSRFDPKDDGELPWSTGLLSYTWRGPNRPPNHLHDHDNQLTYMLPPSSGHPSPLDGKVVTKIMALHMKSSFQNASYIGSPCLHNLSILHQRLEKHIYINACLFRTQNENSAEKVLSLLT
jgi:hypothetical protein